MQTASPKIKPVVSITILIMAAFCCQAAAAGAGVAQQVSTDKDAYKHGETIRVNFSDSPGIDSDWICIVPADSPDTEAGDYQYMPKGLSQGVLTFASPAPGKYEARAYYNYRRNGYVVTARYVFSVADGVASAESKMASSVKPSTAAEKTIPTEKSAATDSSRGASRYSVSVFHFKPVNMDASSYGITVTNTLIHAPGIRTAFAIMDRKDLETFLVANDLQQNDQIENVTNIGTRLGLNFVIAGSIEKRGTMIVTNCKVVSIEQRKVVFTNQSISTGEADLISNIMKMSDTIIEAILRSTS
jgi:TolB-like protein